MTGRLGTAAFRTRMRNMTMGFGAGLLAGVVLSADWTRLVDGFLEARAERKALGVWMKRAVDVDYDRCLRQPSDCVDRVVVWPVQHLSEGSSHYREDPRRPIRWRNEGRVPSSQIGDGTFRAIALVAAAGPEGPELIYIGSPDARFGGTVWSERALDDKPSEDRLICFVAETGGGPEFNLTCEEAG